MTDIVIKVHHTKHSAMIQGQVGDKILTPIYIMEGEECNLRFERKIKIVTDVNVISDDQSIKRKLQRVVERFRLS